MSTAYFCTARLLAREVVLDGLCLGDLLGNLVSLSRCCYLDVAIQMLLSRCRYLDVAIQMLLFRCCYLDVATQMLLPRCRYLDVAIQYFKGVLTYNIQLYTFLLKPVFSCQLLLRFLWFLVIDQNFVFSICFQSIILFCFEIQLVHIGKKSIQVIL